MSKAFTLIELLVVIAVITILSALILPNYGGGSKALALQRSASKLAQDLRRAQEMAMSSREVEGSAGEKVVPDGGYGVYIWFSGSNYNIVLFADCDEDGKYTLGNQCGSDPNKFPELIESLELESGVKIAEFAPDASRWDINFRPPDPSVSFYRDGSVLPWTGTSYLIVLLNSIIDESYVKGVVLNSAGLIYVESSAAPPAPPPPPACGDNGASCTSGSECCSENCYADVDADGDGYPAASGDKTCKASASLGDDCYDLNANARPGQTNYYTTSRGDGSFDYDCDGVETKYPVYDCVTTMAQIACTTNGAAFTGLRPGWVSSNPACGAVAQRRICVGYNLADCGGGGGSFSGCSQTGCFASPAGYYGTIDNWDAQRCR